MTKDIPTRANAFPCRLRLVWNDTLVMDALCSTVVAYDVARQHIADNFAGSDHKAFVARTFAHPALERLTTMHRLDAEWYDASGYARAIIGPAPR